MIKWLKLYINYNHNFHKTTVFIHNCISLTHITNLYLIKILLEMWPMLAILRWKIERIVSVITVHPLFFRSFCFLLPLSIVCGNFINSNSYLFSSWKYTKNIRLFIVLSYYLLLFHICFAIIKRTLSIKNLESFPQLYQIFYKKE